MENLNSNNPDRQPDVYHLTDEEIQRNFAQDREAFGIPNQAEAQDTFEKLEDEPDYVEKLTMTPLPLDTLRGLLDEMAQGYDSGNYDQQTVFKRQFVGTMQAALDKLAQTAKPGDSITFDDLSWAAEDATGHTDKINPDSILNDPSFAAETDSTSEITDRFARLFGQRPDLEYIGDNIDKFTVHPDIHAYQKERVRNNPNADFYGEEHGDSGRWIPEKRGDMTVWVAKEQKQQEQKQEAEQSARSAVERAYTQDSENSQADAGHHNQAQEIQPDDDPRAEMLAKIPDTSRERIRFAKENFTGKFDLNKTPMLAAFLTKELRDKAANLPEGAVYIDNVASVVGNGGDTWHYLRAVLAAQQGRELEPNDFSRLSFSEVARTIGIDVKKVVPDYEQRFRTKQGV